MPKHLTQRSARSLINIGQRILPKLNADVKLAPAGARMQSAQNGLEAKFAVHEEKVALLRTATAVRDDSYLFLSDRMREFGLNVLGLTRNHHDADPFRRYFTNGYGAAIHAKPEEISGVADVVMGKLDEEDDPWIVSLRDRIGSARNSFVTAQASYEVCFRAEREAFQYLEAEKLLWIQGLAQSRLLAQGVYLGAPSYIRSIYLPALRRERNGRNGEAESPNPPETGEAPSAATPATPATPAAPVTPATSTAPVSTQPAPPAPPGATA